MNKIVLSIFLISLIFGCKQERETTKSETDLQQKKTQIQKQIDSLNKILSEIDTKLNSNKEQEFPKITAFKIRKKSFTHYLEIQGNIDTDGNVTVVPEVMGVVKKVYKNEGSKVKKGEVIMVLDDAVIRNQISEVQTQYDLAKTTYERQKRLWNQKIGSEMAYLQAKTKKESLQRKLNTLYTQLKKFKLRAPISGVVDDIMIKEGEMAAPQRPAIRLINLNKVYMQADVSEKYLTNIKKGTLAKIYFPELNKKIHAKVNYVGNFIHPNNRTFKIRINLSNNTGELKPNLTGNIQIKVFEAKEAIVLPLSYIQQDQKGENFVFVLKPYDEKKQVYKVQKQHIKIGKVYKNNIMINSGLNEGDYIAGILGRGLTEGDLVKISISQEDENQQNTEASNN